jgi:dihydroorotate dehydrogenase (fumarate)
MTPDMTTTYLGLRLASPLVVSASPVSGEPDVLQRLEASGAGAAVLPSLFEEQFAAKRGTPGAAIEGRIADFPYAGQYNSGPESYVQLIQRAKKAVAMPIIASLNGASAGGWIDFARQLADAGADALELNIYWVSTDVSVSSQQLEQQYVDLVAAVRHCMHLPLAVKLGPYFTALPHFAHRLVVAGANGLVLFNRFLEPEINLETEDVEPHLKLSEPGELRLPMRWVAILHGQLPNCSLALSSGVHTGCDGLKALAAGADVAMVTSALLRHGAEYLQSMYLEMVEWLREHDYASARELIGRVSRNRFSDPAAFERANYVSALVSYLDEGPQAN